MTVGLVCLGLLLLIAAAALAGRREDVAPWCVLPAALGLWALIAAALSAA